MIELKKHLIHVKSNLITALEQLNNVPKNLTLFVLDENQRLVGTLTDGDIRRGIIKGKKVGDTVEHFMTKDFSALRDEKYNVDEIRTIKQKGVKLLPILDNEGKISRVIDFNTIQTLLPIDAVLMVGGKGERLRPLTEKTSKPLLKIGDKTIIDYNIDRLLYYGIENIFVTVNYLKEQLEEHFKKPRDGIKIKCIREPKYLGTIGSVKYIYDLQNNDVLVMNSDLFTNIDYEDFFIHYKKHTADISIAVIHYSFEIPYGVFELKGRKIQNIKEKPTYSCYANAGVYLIKRDLLKYIPDNLVFNATDLIEMLINKGFIVIRYPIMGYWIDIGKFEDYNKAKELARHL